MNTFSTINSLALRVIETGDDEAPRSELLSDGAATGVLLDGAILEAALRWHEDCVLFVTDDVPSEDSLHIYLLGADFHLIDSACLGAMYSTGSFSNLKFMPPDTLSFRFFGGTDWHLDLLMQPQPRLPFMSDPRGVTRPFGFSRRMIVSATPRSETG